MRVPRARKADNGSIDGYCTGWYGSTYPPGYLWFTYILYGRPVPPSTLPFASIWYYYTRSGGIVKSVESIHSIGTYPAGPRQRM